MPTVDTSKFDAYLDRHAGTIGEVIHHLWEARDRTLWSRQPHFYVRLGTIADHIGQVMFAHDVLSEGVRIFPDSLKITHLYSLSAIKCGFLLEARDLLARLVKEGHEDEETLGILGRLYKEMWLLDGGERADHPSIRTSRNLYLKAFLKSHGTYSGINAATMSALIGDWDTAGKLARRVMKICEELVAAGRPQRPWIEATMGEAAALLGEEELALRSYGAARSEAGDNLAEVASMRRQLKLLRRVTPLAEELLAEITVPPVAAFVGHNLDRPGRRRARFPAASAAAVKQAIAEAIAESGARIGYSSAACGSDVLFLECLQERRGETNTVLPFARADFFATSVAYAGAEWIARAGEAIDRSTTVEETGRGGYHEDRVLFSHANRIIMGRAILRSRLLETDPLLLSVWDGRSRGEGGGTFETIAAWRRLGLPHRNIEPMQVRQTVIAPAAGDSSPPGAAPSPREARAVAVGAGEAAEEAGSSTVAPSGASAAGSPSERSPAAAGSVPAARPFPRGIRRRVVALVFADLVGYTRLAEDQVPAFVHGFLGSVVGRMRLLHARPLFKNLWGDALCFAFAEPLAAAGCALELRDLVRETDWSALGLPSNLALRIGLHAGPVFGGREPVLNQPNFFGSHVNLAARIEPITRPGNVYASEHFVALLVATGARSIDCRYVGVITLPKEFGSYPIYLVKRAQEIE